MLKWSLNREKKAHPLYRVLFHSQDVKYAVKSNR